MSNHYEKYGKKWYEANREKEVTRNKEYYETSGKQKKLEAYPERRRRILKSRYGITPEQFEDMFKKQDGKCAICNETYHLTMHIDHCHATGKVRGLLCNNCNRGLGHFKDSRELLARASTYLTNALLKERMPTIWNKAWKPPESSWGSDWVDDGV